MAVSFENVGMEMARLCCGVVDPVYLALEYQRSIGDTSHNLSDLVDIASKWIDENRHRFPDPPIVYSNILGPGQTRGDSAGL